MSEDAKQPAKQSWFKGLTTEFKKITWPTKKELVKESGAVVVVTVILGVLIALVDLVIKYGLSFLL